MTDVTIVVNDQMLAAALGDMAAVRPLDAAETRRACETICQAGDTPYPAWYLFGCRNKGVQGLVRGYSAHGAHVRLLPEKCLTPGLETDLLDVQLCSLSEKLYSFYSRKNLKIRGYLPDCLASKSVLHRLFCLYGGRRFLPLQITCSANSPGSLPFTRNGLWLIKYPCGSAGRSGSGKPYTVWTDKMLRRSLPQILRALAENEEIIISEWISTFDPYAGFSQHVVHKAHYIILGENGPPKPYGRYCQRFIHRCDWDALQRCGSLSLANFVGGAEIASGQLETIRDISEFSRCLSFHRSPVLLSVDFMIPTDGIPRFLESNKLAATFAEMFDPDLPAPIDYYTAEWHTD